MPASGAFSWNHFLEFCFPFTLKEIYVERRFSRISRGAMAAAVVLAGAPFAGGCQMKPSGAAVTTSASKSSLPTKAAPTAGQEVAEVKALMGEMKNMKDIQEMSEFLTNESAAALGIVMTIPLLFVSAMEDMGGQMAAEMSKLGGGQAQAPKPSSGPKIKAELEATMKKYGLSDKTQPDDKQAMAALTSRGREFFRDMTSLLAKMDKNGKGKSGFDMSGNKTPDPEDATYEVLTPTRVKVTPRDPKDKMMEKMEARFEDGRWRFHFGGIEDLMKEGMGKMGGGMGMPSALK